MKLKKKLKTNTTAWDNALQFYLQTHPKCLCGKFLHECGDAYAHQTQGY
tara:strand:+ start:3030 stop:3176 length:147 start_codon:yes stop_codon:yes gene_type:complete